MARILLIQHKTSHNQSHVKGSAHILVNNNSISEPRSLQKFQWFTVGFLQNLYRFFNIASNLDIVSNFYKRFLNKRIRRKENFHNPMVKR